MNEPIEIAFKLIQALCADASKTHDIVVAGTCFKSELNIFSQGGKFTDTQIDIVAEDDSSNTSNDDDLHGTVIAENVVAEKRNTSTNEDHDYVYDYDDASSGNREYV